MSIRIQFSWVLILTFLVPAAVRGQDAEKKKHAVNRGVAHLKQLQKEDGSWTHFEKTGMTALAGLALLEAGVAKKDPCLLKAAAYVRERITDTSHTYSVSLALLFLDRLGWDQDLPLLG